MTRLSTPKLCTLSPVALVLLLLALVASGCGGPPDEALDAANRSLLDSAWAEECAEDTYRAAQKMLEEAHAASAAGEYDEARRKADAATRLAEQARKDAELNREECQRRNQARQQITEKLDPNAGRDTTTTTVTTAESFKLHTVYFDFNESILSEDSQALLQENARWLNENQGIKVRIEGHTDERGSTEYNLALSQRRAQSVKRFLQTLGVEAARMSVVPYGEEKPAAYGSSESDHARNRRAEFATH